MNLEMAAEVERPRTEANEAMADVFDQVDFVIAATNPDVAFAAEVTLNTTVGDVAGRARRTTARSPSRPTSSATRPSRSRSGTVDGLPVGLQVIGRHHEDALLLDLALVERERPGPWWPPAPR